MFLKKNMLDSKRSGCAVNIKTAHASYPKAFLEVRNTSRTGGTHLAMGGMVDGVQMHAVGCEHCKKKTICLLFTKGAPSTEEGGPYRERWKVENGNIMHRQVKDLNFVLNIFLHLTPLMF